MEFNRDFIAFIITTPYKKKSLKSSYNIEDNSKPT